MCPFFCLDLKEKIGFVLNGGKEEEEYYYLSVKFNFDTFTDTMVNVIQDTTIIVTNVVVEFITYLGVVFNSPCNKQLSIIIKNGFNDTWIK